MRSRFLAPLLALCALPLAQLLYPGCATLIDGTTQQVRVKSQPRGARVFLNGKLAGTTPLTAAVSRWGWHRVRIEMPGFAPYEVKLHKHYNSTATGNLFIGGAWIVVDALTGAIFVQELSEEDRRAMLKMKHERGDPGVAIFGSAPVVITTELIPAATARKVGQLQPDGSFDRRKLR
jgi:hypothetical protein